jgi:hypothetical protein
MIGRLLRILLTVAPVASRVLSLGPRIQKEDGLLVAATGWRLRLLTLGMMLRWVIVDPKDETVTVRDRYFWLFGRTRTLRFRDIQAVTYGYDDWSPGAVLSDAHRTLDCYQVGLCLGDEREMSLFHFFGEGGFVNDSSLPDWFFWPDYALDLIGTQQPESRLLVELLGKMIGVTVQPPQC